MKTLTRYVMAACLMLLPVVTLLAAQHPAMPAGMTHEQHLAQIKKDAELKARGALAMGFDQDKTTHHFEVTPSGGVIRVEVNDAADARNLDAIRAHLTHIAAAFGEGLFDKPLATHAEMPPGVDVMQALKAEIAYRFASLPRGGEVRITTSDSRALAAIHEFLHYQIREHKTH
jgi:hypothetical protein